MNVSNRAVFTICLPLFIIAQVLAEDVRYEDLKAALIFRFAQNVTWKNENRFPVFTIGVCETNGKTLETLQRQSKTSRIKGKSVTVRQVSAGKPFNDLQLLFLGKDQASEIGKIWRNIEKKTYSLSPKSARTAGTLCLTFDFPKTPVSSPFRLTRRI